MTKRNPISDPKEDGDLHLHPKHLPKVRFLHTIKGRIFLLLLVVLVPILLIQTYIFYSNFKNSREQALRSNLEVARTLEKAFDAFIQGIFRQELSIGLAATSSPPLSNQELKRILEKNAKDLIAVQRLSWLDPKGYSLVSSLPTLPDITFADRKYFREILAGRECVVGDLVLSKVENFPFFHIARAIRDEKGILLGVVLATIDPEKLDSVLGIERSKNAAVSLLDPQGMLVYRYPHIKQTWEERNWFQSMPLLEKSLREEISGIIIASYDNEKRIFANVPIKSIGWSAGAGIRESVVLEPIITTLLYHGAAFSIITFLAFIVALAISRTVSSPVERLRAHALALGRGEFGKRIDPTGPAEMRTLAETFNAMAEQINDAYEELRDSEQRWATTVASIGDGVITTDVGGRITFMNAIAESLAGWELNEASRKPVVEVFKIINEQTRQTVENPVNKVLEKGDIVGLANHTILVRKDGKEVPIDDSGAPIKDLSGKTTGVVLVFRDITERKRAEEKLREAHERAIWLARFPDENPSPIVRASREGKVLYCNPAARELPGWTCEVGCLLPEPLQRQIVQAMGEGKEIEQDVELAGRFYYFWAAPFPADGYVNLYGRDITERKQAEVVLQRYRILAYQSRDIVLFVRRDDGHILEANAAAVKAYGYTQQELLTLSIHDLRAPETRRLTPDQMAEADARGILFETVHRRKDGGTFPVEVSSRGATISEDRLLISIIRDITERKRVEETLRKERDFSAAVLDTAGALVVVLDKEGRIMRFNRACEAITGYSSSEVMGRVFWEFLVPPEEQPGVLQTWEALRSGDFPNKYENRWVAKDGSMRLIAWTNTAIVRPVGEIEHIIGTGLDITERKHREFRIARLTKLYAVLSQVNEAIVRIHDEGRLYGEVCRIVAEQGGFPLVWIGQVQGQQIVQEAACGPATAYLKEIRVETEGELGSGPTGTCVREDRPAINDNFDINPSTSPWRKPALRFGFRASAAFPLHRQGRVVGVFTLYAAEPGAFDQEQVNLLEALCADVSYALDAMQQEQMRNKAEEALQRRTLELQQLTAILEQRVQERTEALEKSHKRLQQLASQLIQAQEKERKRVAVELHDSLLSELAAMKFLFEAKLMLLKKGQLADTNEFDKVTDIMQKVMKDARAIMNNLRPSILDEMGLISTIDWFSREYQKAYAHIQIRTQLEVLEKDIPDILRVVIFRVLQEALNNFAKHGRGNLVELSLLKSGDTLHLRIQDNGEGFDVGKVQKGLGLESMQERVEISGGEFHD